LKGPYKGQLLSAISRDGNNNMYPVALAVVEAKTKDSWIWFLESLLSDLGIPPEQGWTFISDHQKVTILYVHYFSLF
jgi:zinc finger SWIM domain-containing protein 3